MRQRIGRRGELPTLAAMATATARNHGEDQEMIEKDLGGGEDQHGRPSRVGGPSQVGFESVSESRSSLY
ncbi:hypothetical protein EJB05_52504, partial [Eragrostis curvula]